MAHLQELASMSHMEIKEKASIIEAVTAALGAEFEMANRYEIFNNSGQQVFFAAEQTDCCKRQLKSCLPDCIAWDVDIIYLPTNQVVYKLSRPFSCTCCCFNRPTITITDETQGREIGSIKDPCACCDLTFTLRGPDEEAAIYGRGGCCQWGLCCPLPCGPCSTVEFGLEDANSGSDVGTITKHVPSCCKFLFASDVDNYKIDFGGIQNPDYKALVMAMAIFIDFRYFSDNSNDDEGGIIGMFAE
jgi:hypothetical protein